MPHPNVRDGGSISLWVALMVPVLALFFFSLFLGLLLEGQDRARLQDSGDLAAQAAAGCLDESQMLAGQTVFDETAAAAMAQDYLEANYAARGIPTRVAEAQLADNGLALDGNDRILGGTDGITVRFLYPGRDVDPTTGGYVTKPYVLIAALVTVDRSFGGSTTYPVYSLASPE